MMRVWLTGRLLLALLKGFLGVIFVATSVVYGSFRPNEKASFWPLWNTCHNLCYAALEEKIPKNERIGTRTWVWHLWQVRKDNCWHSFFSTKFLTSFLKCHNRKRCQICETSYLPWHEIIQNMTTKLPNPLAVWISSWGTVLQTWIITLCLVTAVMLYLNHFVNERVLNSFAVSKDFEVIKSI